MIIVAALVVISFFTSYHFHSRFGKKAIVVSAEIDAPAGQVFGYMTQSENARNWLTFVDRVTPLEKEGAAGRYSFSERRCIAGDANQERCWDETLLAQEEGKWRKLKIHNIRGFPVSWDSLISEQIIETVDSIRCTVIFALYLDEDKASMADRIKLYLAAFRVSEIFEGSLKNLARINGELFRDRKQASRESASASR